MVRYGCDSQQSTTVTQGANPHIRHCCRVKAVLGYSLQQEVKKSADATIPPPLIKVNNGLKVIG